MTKHKDLISHFSRRQFLKSASGLALAPLLSATPLRFAMAADSSIMTRPIPVSGEPLPIIGLGSWITFDVGRNQDARNNSKNIMQAFFERGGGMIDSSPMYGSAEEVIGDSLQKLGGHPGLFSATKVWIIGHMMGIYQMRESQKLWKVPQIDLMQIHNMLDWRTHLKNLKEWKEAELIRYIGITTSHGRRHEKMEEALLEEDFDFVQFTYNVVDREAEQRLLPLAKEKGIAVIINRPFQRGALFDLVKNKPLPAWASEIDCENWAQFFLKFIVSHPAVTCAIPATSQLVHLHENMGAGSGRLPDKAMRARMAKLFS